VRLESLTDGVVPSPEAVALGPVAAAASAPLAAPIPLSVRSDVPCGIVARLVLVVRSDGVDARIPIDARIGAATTREAFADGFEAGEGGWRHTKRKGKDLWALSDERVASGAHAWYTPATGKVADTSLESPPIAIPAAAVGARFAFSHTYSFEGGGFDGAVIEVSDGGEWVDAGDLIVAGGYTGRLTGDFFNPLAGRFAWVGGKAGEFSRVVVDLGAYRGREVRLRFRLATDLLNAGQGWFVDDATLEVDEPACGP
jgi:hypothetical protein